MDIYRQKDGIYQCINNPDNVRKYVLLESEGCYPALVPVADDTMTVEQASVQPLPRRTAIPIPHFSEKDNTND